MIVVHPTDPSTRMLGSIYDGLPDVKLFDSYLQREEILSAIAAAPKDEPILLLGFGDMLREGRSIREAADELMNPVWIVNELTEYNYSRLVYLDEEYSETADMPQSIYMVRVK